MSIELHSVGSAPGLRLTQRIRQIPWSLVILVTMVASIGFAMLYSAANGNWQPWASKQMARFAIAFVPMLAAALIDIRYWYRLSYWFYALALLLVIAVDLRGVVGMGAQRWIDLKLFVYLAERRPDWTIAIIGETLVDVALLRRLPNIKLLGRKPYEELPRYCKSFSVGLMPFAMNECVSGSVRSNTSSSPSGITASTVAVKFS